jgi:hypothetical protein
MRPDAPALVDVARYPIEDAESHDAITLAQYCRAELDATGVCVLPGFLRPDAVVALAAEADGLAGIAHHSDVQGTPYLELPDDGWPDGHPRVTWGRSALDVVAYDHFPDTSPLRALYEWEVLRRFLADALDLPEVFRYDDPLGALNLAIMGEGDELAWHFDQTDFVVSIAIQESTSGGDFECAQLVRDPDDERYDAVAAVLGGEAAGVVTVPMTPGTLMLFEGRRSLHRVTPIEGARPRYVALLGYDRVPGTCSSELLRAVRYGRTH